MISFSRPLASFTEHPSARIASLFIRELFWGLKNGAQHCYLVFGLVLGLALLLLLGIGLSVLHTQVYESILGRAGGARVWMDSSVPLTPKELKNPLRLKDGRPLHVYPYTDIMARTLAPPGVRNTGLHGRIIPAHHPLRKVLQPVAGGKTALNLGFLGNSERPFQSLGDDFLLSESPLAVIYMGLRALPTIDWQAQIERAPALLKPDYEFLHALASDCRLTTALRTSAGMDHLFGEGEEPDMAQECGESQTAYKKRFSEWRQQLAGGGNRRSGLFLDTGEWIRMVWIRDIPLPGGFDYLMDYPLGQALKLRSPKSPSRNADSFETCRVNLGSRYSDVALRIDANGPVSAAALYPCLDPCFEKGAPDCRMEDVKYGEQKLIGPGLYPAWLTACPALADRLRYLSPGNQAPTVDRICAGFEVHQVDVYLPEYGALPEAERLLKEKWGMKPGIEARDALARVSELTATLDSVGKIGRIALLTYLCVVLMSLQDNLARRRQGTLGQLRAHGLRGKYVLLGGMVADSLSWLLSAGVAMLIAYAMAFLVLDTEQAWEHFTRGIMDVLGWLVGSLLLHLSFGALIHWWRVLRLEPGENLSAVV
uniref:Uncharacterized protein n=1 Tax=Candidatus Kentrum sp. MB TaxID=2138164 RepID=A0A450XW44_9GAMM|nr:MAG: hypothetical protein BECKMB1821G_GA0114241_11612 [Candidatus Kentron sp. MB]